MKKGIIGKASLAAIALIGLAGCGSSNRKETIVIFDENMKEVQRIQVDSTSDYGDGGTKYLIGKDKHILKNVPHDIITKVDDDE